MQTISLKYYFELICLLLVFLGSLNWGLIGLLEYDVVKNILNYQGARVLYVLVGLSGITLIPAIYKKVFNA